MTVNEEFLAWLKVGTSNGWCSRMVCETHDGVPRSDMEEDSYQNGGDPCVHIVRIYLDIDLDKQDK